MGLLTQSLFKPVQDWIRAELGTPPGAPIVFRFDRFGTTLSDADFMLPGHPELGFSPELAIERFSDLVNRTPVDLETGDDVAFSEIDFDTSYFFRLVMPAQPYLPAELDNNGRQDRIEAFSVLKAEAQRLWEELGTASLTGQLLEFRPSTPEPVNWYDPANAAGWQSRTFTISGTDHATPMAQLHWRLQPDNIQLGKAIGLTEVEVQRMSSIELLRRAAILQRGEPAPALVPRPAASPRPVGPGLGGVGQLIQPNLAGQLSALTLADRILAKRQLLENAPTQPTTTSSSAKIAFDACLIRISRPWLFWPLLTDATWSVPNLVRGAVTRPGGAGALTWLPTSMLAIRNLRIAANWSAQDVAASALATNFGPFAVRGKIANGVLESPGLQVVGWQMERLPVLPPNDVQIPAPKREYVVVKGDTLWRIARIVYGNGKRWPEIATANNLTDPNRLEVGQRLVIP